MGHDIEYGLGTVCNFHLNGFATGDYSCHCVICKINYSGDKRSHLCLGCAIKDMKKTIGRLTVKTRESSASTNQLEALKRINKEYRTAMLTNTKTSNTYKVGFDIGHSLGLCHGSEECIKQLEKLLAAEQSSTEELANQ